MNDSTITGFGLSQIGQIAIPVSDIDRAVAFYRDTLGMRFLFQAPPGLAFFDCAGVRLLLDAPAKAQPENYSSIIYFTVPDISPTFEGFPKQALDFMSALDANNNREWFQAHKHEYQQYVLAPTRDFVFALGERLREISPGIRYDTRASGGSSILRIYRDLRFSKDKTPYNPNVRVVFWEGAGKRIETPGFFVRIQPGDDGRSASNCAGGGVRILDVDDG